MIPKRPLRLIFGIALAFTVVMALLPQPPQLPLDRYGDKFEHILAFTTLALLARLSFRRIPSLLLLERLSYLGALIEIAQAWPPLHRDCDLRDWIADTIAIAVVLALTQGLYRHPPDQPQDNPTND